MRPNDTWHREFGDDAQRWLKAVRADLLAWGFNSVGWVWVYVAINDQHHRHSRSFTPEEYRWLNMPYRHLLPLIESHQWEIETRLLKIDSPEIAERCDSVARDRRKVPPRGRERLAALTIACDWNASGSRHGEVTASRIVDSHQHPGRPRSYW